MPRKRISILAAAFLVMLSGCLPYSCRREESTALVPSDSLSREMAASVQTDTLRLGWSRSAAGERDLLHPRTVRFGDDATDILYVGDAEVGIIFVYDTAGAFLRQIPTVDVPYLAGIHGDTVAIFNPEGPAMLLVVGESPVDTISIKDPGRTRTSLVYGAYGDELYYKRLDDETSSFVAEVDRSGSLIRHMALPGPQWRHAGLLRMWGDSAISLSGYRPVIDIAGDGSAVDTLALQGFDSPMLSRSRAFMLGDIHEPPLLSSSAAPEGDYLFVLNMRAGWLQVDVFNRRGEVVRRLAEGSRSYRKAFYPQDLDVRRRDGVYEIAVVFTQPRPEVRYYTWHPAADDRRAVRSSADAQ